MREERRAGLVVASAATVAGSWGGLLLFLLPLCSPYHAVRVSGLGQMGGGGHRAPGHAMPSSAWSQPHTAVVLKQLRVKDQGQSR